MRLCRFFLQENRGKMTKTLEKPTITERLLTALSNGDALTTKQIRSRFGAKNPGRAIHYLRSKGHNITFGPHERSRGRITLKYSMVV